MTPETTLTPEQILSAAEDVLRRFGPAKATVVDIARALGVSHGSVYRHFPSKAALREAVTQRWLDQAHESLHSISIETGPAGERLHRWLSTLFAAKRKKALDDPELFATYLTLVAEHSNTVDAHLQTLTEQIAHIIQDGIWQGEFSPVPVAPTARAVFQAGSHFHDPGYAGEWADERRSATDFEALWALLHAGLRGPWGTPDAPASKPRTAGK
ncbi:TetR family transcriptional regulator [Kitasatospora sp. NBC_01250]|uniref:TetR family transcriptional regulator n=1 Tax=unclassified Kitasatospora TaxID=2633591 RepID=UPI002E117C0A|nr:MULTISPECIES: TetR family transcriptional regulator [unclassified Kitasatospora]WSJ66346.1 TetR family transcriptional regulator [Kitasatospora sp. NBC_01302]